ncbi:MAG: hypothetical protein GTO14_13800 [Anaerolineales bacterium]|nr:hypothetical protein [Anaerolineales bacterium]
MTRKGRSPNLILLLPLLLLISSCTRINPDKKPYAAFTAGDHNFSIVVDGLKRVYIVHIPPSYDTKTPTPLLFALHGGGGNASGSVDYFQLNEKADREGFLVVYPEGTGRRVLGRMFGSWNAGSCCAPALDNEVDDVAFFESLIQKLETDFHVDVKRVFVLGMSNGAQMAFRLACELSDRIAAIATSGSIGSYDACQPARPIPVIHIQGVEDPCSPYEGGECGGCMADLLSKLGIPVEKRIWPCVSVPDYMQTWSEWNQCEDQTEVAFQNGDATCITYLDCPQDAEITLCTVEGMGHTWAGRETYGAESCHSNPDGYVCRVWIETVGALSDALIANDVIWDFFVRHPMR